MREWQEVDPAGSPQLRDLVLTPDQQEVVAALHRRRVWRVKELRTGLAISTRSFVGSVQLGSLTIRIEPKVAPGPLAALVRYALRLPQLELLPEHESTVAAPAFQDLLIHQLGTEATRLLARGIFRNYVARQECGQRLRGRVLLNELARRPANVSADLPYRFHDRHENVLPNQVLLAGLQLAKRLAVAPSARLKVAAPAAMFPENVAPARLNAATFTHVRRSATRLTSAYSPAVAIIQLLHRGFGMSLADTDQSATAPGFVFDMNALFQEVLGRFMTDHLPEVTVHQQHRLNHLFDYQDGFNPRRKLPPTPRPDYVIADGGSVVGIADAKYRDLWERDLPPSMLYQLSIYALSHPGCTRATILYPTVDPRAREARIAVRDLVTAGQRGEVCLRPVNLDLLARCLLAAEGGPARRERVALATYMAFGA